jgi:PAS domain S-box-containing protein
MFGHNQDFYLVFFNSIKEGICIVDNQGCILMNNNALEEIFGYKRNELLDQKIEILIPEAYRMIHKKHINDYFLSPFVNKKGRGYEFKGL